MDLPRNSPLPQILEARLKEEVANKFKFLLEKKHLYQSVSIELIEVCKEVGVREKSDDKLIAHVLKSLHGSWFVRTQGQSPSAIGLGQYSIEIILPDAKLFCQKCDRLEAYNCISGESLMDEVINENEWIPRSTQVLGLVYVCQSCKGIPEVFMVRRDNLKLVLCGRAPMETVSVPQAVPKSVSNYYSGAVVAYQSGQTLAALFLFRTLLEQWRVRKSKTPPIKQTK